MSVTANPQTKNLDVTGFDSSRFLAPRGGVPRSTGEFPESLESAIFSCSEFRDVVFDHNRCYLQLI